MYKSGIRMLSLLVLILLVYLMKDTISETFRVFSLMDFTVDFTKPAIPKDLFDDQTEDKGSDINTDKEARIKGDFSGLATRVIDKNINKTMKTEDKGTTINVDQKSRIKGKFTGLVNRVINKDINKTNKSNFIKRRSSLKSICQEFLLKYSNAPLDQTVLRELLKRCLRKGKEKVELLLNTDFLRSMMGNVGCTKTDAEFLEGAAPFVALASFPGSGNTWTRTLIETVTGIYTGSLYGDSMAHFVGSKLCPTEGGVFIVKTHKKGDLILRQRCPTNSEKFSRAIFILRNPYDAFMAEFNRINGGKVDFASQEAYKSNNWRRFVKKCAERWMRMTLYWLRKYDRPVHVLVYEDLKRNTVLEMYRVMNFLHINVTLRTLYCLVNNPEERYYRAVKPDWLVKSNLYDKEMITLINTNINFIRQEVNKNQEKVFKNYILSIKK